MSLRLHPKYGVNPTMPVCFLCGQEKGEVALLGAAYQGEAPRYMVVDRAPCERCRAHMKVGVILVEALGESMDTAQPQGGYAVLSEEGIRKLLSEPLLTQVLRTRIAFVHPEVWTMVGLRELCAARDREAAAKEASGPEGRA